MGSEWATAIAELIDNGDLVINDGYRAKNSELSTDGLPFARAQNINNGFQFENADCFPKRDIDKVGIKISQPGDVVFTSKGTVGRFAFVREDTPRFVYAPQLCFWRSLNHKKIYPRWLYYWMQSREFFVQYSGVAGQTDMAEYVSLRDQRRMHITLPPLPEQRAIARILGALDDKIELNRQMNATLEAIARALFKSWFVDFDPVRAKAEGGRMKDEIADLFPDEFVDSELGEIPKGWTIEGLYTIATLKKESAKPMQTPAKLWEHYSIPAFDVDRTPAIETGAAIKSNKYRVPPTSVLVSKLNPQFPRVWLPDVQDVEAAICSTEFMPFVPLRETWRPFLYELMKSDIIQQGIHERLTGSTGSRQRAKPDDVAAMRVIVPNSELIEIFSDIAGQFHERMLACARESRTLAALRDTLLPKLISGELRVPEKITQDSQDSQD
ncbi:MAG TPA: restriction endonuclease subunit S [Anaerolineae bacterium]|nr:restriction endonuclease subunit S [Anaerolineae bacterium]